MDSMSVNPSLSQFLMSSQGKDIVNRKNVQADCYKCTAGHTQTHTHTTWTVSKASDTIMGAPVRETLVSVTFVAASALT